MPRTLSSPNAGTAASHIQPILLGGTGAASAPQALSNLGAIALTKLAVPNGIAKLNSGGTLDLSAVPDSLLSGPMVFGLPSNYINQVSTYQITNFDSVTTYTVSAISGTVSRNGEIITYTAPGIVGNGGFTVNGKSFSIPIVAAGITAPSITSPINGAVNQSASVALTSSAFAVSGGSDTHLSSSWEVATDSSFNTIVASSMDNTSAKLSYTVSGLLVNKTYYARCRHTGTTLGASAWSLVSSFSTKTEWLPTTEQAILTASDKAAHDQYGSSVDISSDGNTVIVGSFGANPSGISDGGQAYVYIRTNNVWTQQAILSASDKETNAMFGVAVALSADGNTAAVSAIGATVSGRAYSGKVYIFVRSGTTWTQQAILTASDVTTNTTTQIQLGWSIRLSADGNTLVAATFAASSNSLSGAGQAYIYIRTGTTWSQQTILYASDRSAEGQFGSSADISSDGNTVIIAATSADPSGITNAGCVYVFTRSGTVWTQQAILVQPTPTTGDYICGVAISGDSNTVAIGAIRKSISGITTGAVIIFTRSGTVWTQQAIFTGSDVIAGDQFGCSVSLSSDGNILAVGANNTTVNTFDSAGKAYIFTRSGTTWAQKASYMASDVNKTYWRLSASYNTTPGSALRCSRDGSTIVVGAYNANIAGQAYILV